MSDGLIFAVGAAAGAFVTFGLCLRWFISTFKPLLDEIVEMQPGIEAAIEAAENAQKLERARLAPLHIERVRK